jgi:hypothetical protein
MTAAIISGYFSAHRRVVLLGIAIVTIVRAT